MLPLKLEWAVGFVYAHGNDLHVGVTNSGKFYNAMLSYYDVKIHVFEVLYGECEGAFGYLCKQIIGLTRCQNLYLQTGMRTISAAQCADLLKALDVAIGNEVNL